MRIKNWRDEKQMIENNGLCAFLMLRVWRSTRLNF